MATTIKIASYNVENLFDLYRSGQEYTEYIPFTRSQWNRKNFSIKIEHIARVIYDLDADIIALQEIESKEALNALLYTLKQKGLYYRYSIFENSHPTTIHNALLSKLPISASRAIIPVHSRRYRAILKVKIETPREPLFLFVNHWKAKSGPESMRIRSAKALYKATLEVGHRHNILCLGDFNSDLYEFKRFLHSQKHNDTHGITGINHILKTTTSERLRTLLELREGSFYDPFESLPHSKQYTHIYKQKHEALDHILINHALYDGKNIEYDKGSFHVFTPPYLFSKKRINRWKMSRSYPKKHLGRGYSDHLPIYLTLSY